ncbi:MAG: glycosyltransferase family 2 protein [Prosthecobacter sp.]|uniref:glycosyltransferase family 2 protein n=1 Tax=Prosthecobacter sp. TaxID=1965333 RepID=UPI003BAF5775
MPPPFFTIVIPTCNRAGLLQATLDAVLSQTFGDFEVIVQDNASTDGTRELVAGHADPRLRYLRQKELVHVGRNWADGAAAAVGEYVIINQDDDLLHRDFLLRCHQAVAGRKDVAMYAAPAWREERGRGYKARLLRTNEGYVHDFLLKDQILYMDGPRMAVSLLNLVFYFLQPSVAIRRETMLRSGGYESRADCQFDIMTQARVLMHGSLAYDPRPGAMYRDHEANTWKTYSRSLRKKLLSQTLVLIIADLVKAGIPWEQHLDAELKGCSKRDLEKALKDWCWCGAPAILTEKAAQELRRRQPSGSSLIFNARLIRKLGWRYLKQRLSKTRT